MFGIRKVIAAFALLGVSASAAASHYQLQIQSAAQHEYHVSKPSVEQTQFTTRLILANGQIQHPGAMKVSGCDARHQLSANKRVLEVRVQGQVMKTSDGGYVVAYPKCNLDIQQLTIQAPEGKFHGVIRQAVHSAEVTFSNRTGQQVTLYKQQSLVAFSYVEA